MIHVKDAGARVYQARHLTFGPGLQITEGSDGLPVISVSTAYGTGDGSTGLIEQGSLLVPFYAGAAGELVDLNVTPEASSEVDTGVRVWVNLKGYTRCRLSAAILATDFSTSKLAVQASDDGGGSWGYLDGSSGPILTLQSTGDRRGVDTAIATQYQKDVLLKLLVVP